MDPNDRGFDPKVHELFKRLDPMDLAEMLGQVDGLDTYEDDATVEPYVPDRTTGGAGNGAGLLRSA